MKEERARIKATETAAPEPSPDATGIVDVIELIQCARNCGNAKELKKLENNRSNWMVSGKRIKFGVQVNAGGVDPDPCAGRIRNFDIHMDLCNGHGKSGAVIHHRMFTEEDDLAGRRCSHER